MNRPAITLGLLAIFLGVNLGLRMWLHWRRTGSTGFHGISGWSVEGFGGVLFAVGVVLGVAAPVTELVGVVEPLVPSRPWWVDAVATCVVALGIGGTWGAQAAMGASWRIGVKQDEHTDFVERGPFRWVRNPIFSCVLLTAVGVALLLPNPLSVASFVSLVIAVELQVRFVEEPYLLRTHGEPYVRYCQRVGRFVPGVGRSSSAARGPAGSS